MKNKPNDIPYLGCNVDNIRKANPKLNKIVLSVLYKYINERYRIFLKREAGEPPPWSNITIFRRYSFTNVRREHDTTTRWVINRICNNQNLFYPDRFYRTILFRIYNSIKTAELIELDKLDDFWTDEHFEIVKQRFLNTTGHAYGLDYSVVSLINGMAKIYPDNMYQINPMIHTRNIARNNNFQIPNKVEDNAVETISWIKKNIPGAGDFIAYQIFVDLTYINEFPISENEFTICGPGCKIGIDYLFNDKDGMSYTECIFWLRDHQEEIFKEIDPNFSFKKLFNNLPEEDRFWSVMSIENCMCELQKYINVITGKKKLPDKDRYV